MYSNYAAPLGVALSAILATSPLGAADPAGKDMPAYRAPEDPAAHDLDPPAEPTGTLTLPQALALALTRNPELAAFSQETRVREAAALQAGLLPNPALNISAENFANSRLKGFDGPAMTLQFSQLIELGGKRTQRIRLAGLERDLASWDYEAKRLDVLTDTRKALVQVLAAQEHLRLAQELVALAEQVQRSAAERVRAGKVSPLEETKAGVATATTRLQLTAAQSELQAARVALAALWGTTAPRFERVEGEIETVTAIPSLEDMEGLVVSGAGRWPRHSTRADRHDRGRYAWRCPTLYPGPCRVRIGKELCTGAASENGEEVVVGTALMLIGENSRRVAATVDRKLAEINKSLPPDIQAKTVLDRTRLVDATIRTVRNNLLEGAILVSAVLFLILGNIRAALITTLVIPLSMLMTATGMVQSRINGNLMSLGAIDFGLIVDGAVIIVENCLRHLAEAQEKLGRRLTLTERLQEVRLSTAQVVRPSVFGQTIIIVVYVPILALTGTEGKMFEPMAATVILALVSAFILSLTLVPAMVALTFTGRVEEQENLFMRLARVLYTPVLTWALRLRRLVVLASVVLFAGALALFARLGQEFVPTLDEKNILTQAMRIPSTSLSQSQEMQFRVEEAIARFPEVAFVFSKTGTAEMATDPMPPNISDTFVILKPQAEWPDPGQSKPELIDRIEDALAKLPGNKYEFTQPIQMRFNELISGIRSDVAVKVFGDEFEPLQATAQGVARILRDIPGAADIKVEQTAGLPVMNIDIDRAAIARYGLNIADVQDVVAIAVGGREAGLVFEGDRRFGLVVRLPDTLRRDLSALRQLPVPLPHRREGVMDTALTGPAFIPLSEVARIELTEGLNQISRENGKRRVVVQANMRGRDIGSFVVEAQQRIDTEANLPAGYWLAWGGQFENLVEARARLGLIVPVCFLIIFLLLFSAFNSLKQAVLIFSGIPFALIGGIVALWLRGMPFSITAAVGFIALSGVAVLNGLVMVSFINQLRQEGVPVEEAIFRGALTRLRPVLMTALVASLGFMPMAIATGTGAEVQKPLATVVIGGLISSTFLTLVVLPALYRVFERRTSEGRTNAPLEEVL